MKLTEKQLRKIIKESIKKVMNETAVYPNYPENTIQNTIWNKYNLPWNKVDDSPEKYNGIWFITVDYFDYTEHLGNAEINKQFATIEDCLNYATKLTQEDLDELCNEEITDEGYTSVSLNILCQCDDDIYEIANTKQY